MTPYDKKNNDTYVEKYSNDMTTDVEIHMFKDDSGNVILGKGIRGNFSVQSRLTAANNVLHFDSAKELNLKLLKHRDIESLIPFSLKKRYAKALTENFYTQKTPIFFNIDSEKFVLSLDNRFLRDLKEHSEFKESLQPLIDNKSVSIIKSNNNEQLLISYDTINDLLKDSTQILKQINNLYIATQLNIYPSEEVIIVAYNLEEQKERFLNLGSIPWSEAKDLISNVKIQFEMLKARKVSDNGFYLYDNENKLMTNKSFHFNKDKARLNPQKTDDFIFCGVDASLLIIPYTDNDWDILKNLKNEVDSIFKDLDILLMKQKTNNSLDQSLLQLPFNDFPLLTDETNNSKNKNRMR